MEGTGVEIQSLGSEFAGVVNEIPRSTVERVMPGAPSRHVIKGKSQRHRCIEAHKYDHIGDAFVAKHLDRQRPKVGCSCATTVDSDPLIGCASDWLTGCAIAIALPPSYQRSTL